MKKLICSALSALMIIGNFSSCSVKTENYSGKITVSSSDAEDNAAWLTNRLGELKNNVFLGIGGEDFDMSEFEDDGYIIKSENGETVIIGKTEEGLSKGVRKYAVYCEDGYDEKLNVAYHEGYRVKKITVADHDISEYSIRIPQGADEANRFAAESLSDYIGKACGIYPEIVTEDKDRMIILRQIESDDELFDTLGDEGYSIEVKNDGNLYITGGRYRGTMYGVFSFLEKYIGWSFIYDYDLTTPELLSVYNSFEEGVNDYLYESDEITIPVGTSYTHTPSFKYRETWATPGINMIPSEKYGVKVGDNGNLRGKSAFNGYGIATQACHGVVRGPASYFPNYPEYDPSTGDGQVRQPCFTDQENIDAAIQFFINSLTTRISLGQVVGKDIVDVDVAQCDSPEFCGCEECRAMFNKEGGHAGPVVYFTNEVAKAVAENVSPDIYVSMLAYWGTTKPPKKLLPEKNVAVSYCFYNDIDKLCCSSHPINGEGCTDPITKMSNKSVSNALYARELEQWCKISDRVLVWLYPGTYYNSPFTSYTLFNLKNDFLYMKNCGVYGFFICPSYISANDGILPYLISRMMFNCELTDEEYTDLIKDYFRIQYGEGWESIYEVTFLCDRAQPDTCWTPNGFCDPTAYMNFDFYRENFDYLISLFDEGIRLADTHLQEFRIRCLSLSVYYAGLCSTYEAMYKNGTSEEKALYLERWNYFLTLAEMTHIGCDGAKLEGFDLDTQHPMLLSGSRNF